MRLSTSVSDALLLGLGVTVIIAIAALWPIPVKAAEPCKYELTPTMLSLQAQGIPHVVLGPADRNRFIDQLQARIGFRFPPIRNVLIASIQGVLVYGLEINGCLTEPYKLTAAPVKQSGATPAGTFA